MRLSEECVLLFGGEFQRGEEGFGRVFGRGRAMQRIAVDGLH